MASNIPVIVQGNSFSLAIPLQIYYINGDQMDLEDYTPDPTDEVSVQLKGSRRNYTYTPTIDGNVANIDLSGNELADNYGVVVSVVKANGQRLRSFRTDQFFIVESSDDLTPADIIQGLEENVIYLNTQCFVAGEDGRGIESIVKTSTAGLVDTYTITYTDNTTSTFQVTNGKQGEQGAQGVGITSIEKTGTSGLVDTYTITLSNGQTSTFEVTNGHDGVDLGEVALVNNLTEGGEGSALTAEMGKVLNEKLTHKVKIPVGTFTSSKALRVDGNVYSAIAAHSVSDYIDVTGYNEFFITCTLWISTTPANCTAVCFYDANKSLIGVVNPSLFTTQTNVAQSISAQYVAVNGSASVKYIRFGNYNNATVSLFGVDNTINRIEKLEPITSGWIKSGVSDSRKAKIIFPRLIVSNGAKIRFSAKVKNDSTSIALTGFSMVKQTYNDGDSADLYDSSWQTNFEDFELPIDYPYETIQFRLKDESLSADATDAQINALLEYCFMVYETPLFGGEVVVQYDLLKSLLEQNQNIDNFSQYLTPVVNSINHRGFRNIAPENTMPAYRLSVQNGFSMVETDIQFTSDNVAVLLHDATINRTARNADGTAISGTVYINSITYEQALTYDFGIWKSANYAGTKIPTLREFLLFCRASGVYPYLELKSEITSTQAEMVVSLVNECGMRGKVTYISFSSALLSAVKAQDSEARLGYIVDTVLTSTHIATAESLQTTENEVFIDGYNLTDTSVNLCKNAGIPYEVWTINSSATILALNPYITGVTSDDIVASKVLFDNLNL